MRALKVNALILPAIAMLFLTACGGSGSNGSSNGSGTLSVGLTDASIDDIKAVYVTIKEVQVHPAEGENNWQVVATPNKTYNLLELVNGAIEQLGLTTLGAGHYTQMRMIIGDSADDGINILGNPHPAANYIIDTSDNDHELKIPSGYQTGVKIVHAFDIADGGKTELVLDFDALKSIVKDGNSKWLLKPTIKVIDTKSSAIVSGNITNSEPSGLEGTMVSAQKYNPDAEDIKDIVVVKTSTITDDRGFYSMYLDPGIYNIVAYKGGYGVACKQVEVQYDASYGADFTLNTSEPGIINGSVTIANPTADQSAVLSFRQNIQCEGASAPEDIEIKSESVTSGTSYDLSLPTATYKLVASTEAKTTQQYAGITLTAGNTVTQDISFTLTPAP